MKYYSIKDFWIFLLKGKIIILISLVLSLVLGLFLYKVTPNGYQSSVSFIILGNDEQNQSRLGGLPNLSVLGLGTTQGIPTSSYEHIALSTSVLADISRQKVEYLGDSILIGNYITQQMNIGWKKKFINGFTGKANKVVYDDALAKDYDKVFSNNHEGEIVRPIELKGSLGASVNTLKNIIQFKRESNSPLSIDVTTGSPEISAIIAKLLLEKLEAFVTLYNQSNKEDNSSFLEAEFKKSEANLDRLRRAYAAAQDANRNTTRAMAKLSVERLGLEYNQAVKLYNDLKIQLETARIQRMKEQSYFIVIEQPRILNIDYPSEPRLVIYVTLSLFLGIFLSFGILIMKNLISNGQN